MTFKEFIYEMAFPQSFAIRKIEELLPTTQLHIYKCLLMPNSTAINHHIKDVGIWLFKMNAYADAKTGRGRPTRELMFNEYKAKFETKRLNSLIDYVIDDYELDLHLSLVEKEKLHEFVREFFSDFFFDIENDDADIVKEKEILRKKIESLK